MRFSGPLRALYCLGRCGWAADSITSGYFWNRCRNDRFPREDTGDGVCADSPVGAKIGWVPRAGGVTEGITFQPRAKCIGPGVQARVQSGFSSGPRAWTSFPMGQYHAVRQGIEPLSHVNTTSPQAALQGGGITSWGKRPSTLGAPCGICAAATRPLRNRCGSMECPRPRTGPHSAPGPCTNA